MSRDHISVAASPERVFEVLSDPFTYGHWVVGTKTIPEADPEWPAPGASLRYVAGAGPLTLSDHTRVVGSAPPHRLDLIAEAGPLPGAAISIELAHEGSGTRVTLDERPAQPLLDMAMGPLGHLALSLRNRVALRRLKRLAEAE
jgi:uncharacterized protein YndB with AHSA1/START domain